MHTESTASYHLWLWVISPVTMMYLLALFGGFVPLLGDLISRQNQEAQKRANLDTTFFVVKAFLIPVGAFFITSICIATDKVTTWEAALYLSISFPYLVVKWIASAQADKNTDVITQQGQ